MNIEELSGLPATGVYHSLEETLEAIVLSLPQQANILVDNYVAKEELAILQAIAQKHQLKITLGDTALLGRKSGYAAVVVAYPNCEGNVEDYSDMGDSLQQEGIRFIMSCQLQALPLLKSPASMGADTVYFANEGKWFCCSKHTGGSPSQALPEIEAEKELAARLHGMCAYLNDALEVYGYQQENNAFFDTLKIHLPQHCNQASFKDLAQDYELAYQPLDEDYILLRILPEDDSESLEAIIDCLAQAGGNFGVPVDEEDWSSICALDSSLLR